jgi:hypothetical protein
MDRPHVLILSPRWRRSCVDQYGQRVAISVEFRSRGAASGRTAQINSGWMIRSDGSITLSTPFSGFSK